MTWIRRYKQKTLISKISVDSNFKFSSYVWLCVFHCSHKLLCCRRKFLWKLLSFHTEMISAQFLWRNVLLRRELRKDAKSSTFENFESALYSKSGSLSLSVFGGCSIAYHPRCFIRQLNWVELSTVTDHWPGRRSPGLSISVEMPYCSHEKQYVQMTRIIS